MSHPEQASDDYPLPVVSLDTCESALRDREEMGHDAYLLKAYSALLYENSVAAETINTYIEGSATTDEERLIASKAAALLHDLLRKQAAADVLNRHINGEL